MKRGKERCVWGESEYNEKISFLSCTNMEENNVAETLDTNDLDKKEECKKEHR